MHNFNLETLFSIFGEPDMINVFGAAILAFGWPFFIKGVMEKVGGAAGWLVGMGSNVAQRIDPTVEKRKKIKQDRKIKRDDGRLYSNNNRVGKTVNALTHGAHVFSESEDKWGFLTDKDRRGAQIAQSNAIGAAKFAGSDLGKSGQYKDGMLRALSFDSEADARAGYKKRFSYQEYDAETGQMVTKEPTEAEIEQSINEARAIGGWNHARKLWAIQQLAVTGTGYNSPEQALRTIHEEAHTPQEREMLAGGIKTANGSQTVMAAGFGKYMEILKRMDDNNGRLTIEDVDEFVSDARKNTDPYALARSKPTSVKQHVDTLRREIGRQNVIAQDASLDATAQGARVRQEAQREVGRLVGEVQQIINSQGYASPINIQNMDEILIQPTAEVRKEIVQRSHEQVSREVTDASGTVRVIHEPNPEYNARTAAGYNQQNPNSRYPSDFQDRERRNAS